MPPYQRDYRWTIDKVSQLFDDLDAAFNRNDDRYFLGLMVFMRTETPTGLEVLDGQQRLTTAFLFLAACRNWLDQSDAFKADAEKINVEFMGERRFGEKIVSPRIVLNSANNQAFKSFVVERRPLKDVERELGKMRKHDRSRRLLEAALYCHKRIAEMAEKRGRDECAARLSQLINFLNERAPVVRLTVPDEGTAFTIFETLNDRGMDLSPLDLVKNHLFRCTNKGSVAQRTFKPAGAR